MLNKIKTAIEKIRAIPLSKEIRVISHFDTDGISSAAIFAKALQRERKNFSLQIVKGVDEEFISNLNDDGVLIFLDLGSGTLNKLGEKKSDIFIFDHHEIVSEIPSNVFMINPHLDGGDIISSAGICYLFAKELSSENRDLANLAVVGMVGDVLDQSIGKTYDEIIKDSGTVVKKGLLIYPATRPLNRVLEYSSNPFIPNVSGSYKGVIELLREANIMNNNGIYKSIYELTDEEMSSLTTAIILRGMGKIDPAVLIGNLYLIKFHNKQEDARELSALINSCGRMDRPDVSLGFCLGNKKLKAEAEKIYIEYKQHIIAALKYVQEAEKISGQKYTIINAKDRIKDTIIGTTASIISRSPLYEEGTIIVALAYNKEKIKVSARIAGRNGRNVREVLARAVVPVGGEVGGHQNAAGCLIDKSKELEFIEELKKILDVETVKV